MTQPLVSIIIPTYNRAHLIGKTLDSVLGQTYANWECIVVDDGSTDNTYEILKTYCDEDARFKYVHRPHTHKPGGNGARNYGFKLSKGEYVNWFDSDDLMYPNFIKTKIQPFIENPNLDVVFSAYHYFDENGIQNRESNSFYSGNIIEDFINGYLTFSPLPYLLKREIINSYKYNENLYKAQDLDFFFSLFTTKKKLKLFHIHKTLHSVRKENNDSIGRAVDKRGLRLLSKHTVNSKVLEYFIREKYVFGIYKYKFELFLDFKKMVDNKNYYILFKSIFKCKFFNLYQKIKILLFFIFYITTGRGITKLKYKFKDGKI